MMTTPEQFMLWFRVNYPALRPQFHAPKIYRAAIAASPLPELLDALKGLLATVEAGDNDDALVKAARAAVAKAEQTR